MKKPQQKQRPVFKSGEGRRLILDHYRTLLQHVDFAYKESFHDTRYGETYVLESGSAALPPLLLLHGSTSNSAAWFGDIGALARHFHVYSVDLIGDAGHSAPVRPDLRAGGYALWLRDLYAALGLRSAGLMGISLGAWIALDFTTRNPELVRQLVLLAPAGLAPIRGSFLLRAILYGITGQGSEGILQLVFGDDPVPEEVFAYARLLGKHYNPYTGVLPVFPDAALRQLSMPLLCIAGEKDALINVPRSVRRLGRLLPGARVSLLPDRGHAVIGVLDRVLPFLMETAPH